MHKTLKNIFKNGMVKRANTVLSCSMTNNKEYDIKDTMNLDVTKHQSIPIYCKIILVLIPSRNI